MIIVTTEGIVEVWAQTQTSLSRVVLASGNLETLKSVTASIQLQGVSEEPTDVGTIDHYVDHGEYWTLELDRNTFKLWYQFEAENYLRYGKNEMREWVREPGLQDTIINLQKENGTYEHPKTDMG